MSILEQDLKRAEERLGKDSPVVQDLRDQIAAHSNGQSFRDLYVTGSVKRPKEKAPHSPKSKDDK